MLVHGKIIIFYKEYPSPKEQTRTIAINKTSQNKQKKIKSNQSREDNTKLRQNIRRHCTATGSITKQIPLLTPKINSST